MAAKPRTSNLDAIADGKSVGAKGRTASLPKLQDALANRGTGRPLLSLDTIVEREFITIDGKPYDMKLATDLSPRDMARIRMLEKRMEAIQGTSDEDATDADWAAIDDAMCEIISIMLVNCSRDVIDRLNDNQKRAVITVFGQAASGVRVLTPQDESTVKTVLARETTDPAPSASTNSTGEASSPVSAPATRRRSKGGQTG